MFKSLILIAPNEVRHKYLFKIWKLFWFYEIILQDSMSPVSLPLLLERLSHSKTNVAL